MTNSRTLAPVCAVIALVGILGISEIAHGDSITFIGSGLNNEDTTPKATVGGQADFTITDLGIVNGQQTFDIKLVLQNTTLAQTGGIVLHQADILTGVVFTIPTPAQLSYDGNANPTLHWGSKYYGSQTDWLNNTPLTDPAVVNPLIKNTWSATLSSTSLGTGGVGTSGFGNTFSMSGLSGGSTVRQTTGWRTATIRWEIPISGIISRIFSMR